MAYSPTSSATFRVMGGTLATKLGAEFTKIQTETDSLDTAIAGGLKVAKGTLAGGAANAFAFAWQNPESSAILIDRVIIDITTQGATATSVMDVGIVANATSTADTLIDGVALTATGTFDNITDKGSNGKSRGKVDANGGTNDYITGKILVANAAELVGKYYIIYTVV